MQFGFVASRVCFVLRAIESIVRLQTLMYTGGAQVIVENFLLLISKQF